MNNKGQGMMSPIKSVSLIFALIIIVMGIIPLLNYFGVISFKLPEIPAIILNTLLVVGGIMLIVDALRMPF